ncbi:MAG TPA: amidase family protein, partial [Mycobacteriales bacterium]
GVVGLKPTFGHIPYVPLSPEGLSHLGVLARDVDTAALLAAVMAGPDPEDPLSAPRPVDPRDPPRPVRIGWLGRDDPSEVDRTVHAATRVLAGLGHHIEEIDVPFADPYPHLVTIVATAEAAAESAEQPAGQSGERPIFDGLADPARLRVAAHGRRLSAVDLMRAQTERLLLIRCLDRVMERFDLLAMPTVSIEPFPVHAWRPDPTTGDEMDWLAWCRSTYPFNLTGQPAICLPAGFTVAGQPVGLQLVGRRGEDSLLLDVSGQFERASPWRWSYPEKDR